MSPAPPRKPGQPYTPAEAADLLRISRSKVYELCAWSKLRHRRVGAKYLIPEGAIDEFLAACEVAPPPSAVRRASASTAPADLLRPMRDRFRDRDRRRAP